LNMILVEDTNLKWEANFMMILMSHKVCNRVAEAPAAEPLLTEEPKRGRGRPPGTARPVEEKLHYPNVGGVDLSKFEGVPVALRNRLTSAFVQALAALLGTLQAFYKGTERDLTLFLCKNFPPIIFALGRSIMTEILTEERGHIGNRIACNCEGCPKELTYQGDVKKGIKTKMGEIEVARSYYHGTCGHSAWPLDVRLGINNEHSALPDLLELITQTTTSQSFPESIKFIEAALPVSLSLGFVEATTATDAKYVLGKLKQEVEKMKQDPSKAAARNGTLRDGVLLVTSDGGFCRVRDHSDPAHEFKLVGFGQVNSNANTNSGASQDPEKYDRMFSIQGKSFVGHVAVNAEAIFEFAQADYFRRGYHLFKVVHGVADGGNWCLPRIANLVQEWQELSLVLDWWHASERVFALAKLTYPEDDNRAETAGKDLNDALWGSNLGKFFTGLAELLKQENTPEKIKEIREGINYFEKRRQLLRYRECRQRNLPVGSGVIEGGIRFLGKDRLAKSGMSWNIKGADGMLVLRCCKYSDRLDEFYRERDLERFSHYKLAEKQWLRAA
jgi:hypothetical protein